MLHNKHKKSAESSGSLRQLSSLLTPVRELIDDGNRLKKSQKLAP